MGLLFGKKSSKDDGPAMPAAAAAAYSSEKASQFFDKARVLHETTSYEYAMSLWLQGLGFDPTRVDGLRGFFDSAAAFRASDTRGKGPSKDTVKPFTGRSDVERYQFGLLKTGTDPDDVDAAIKAAEMAGKLGLREAAVLLAERAMLIASKDKKPRRDWFIRLMNVFSAAESFTRAVQAGEVALKIGPADPKLTADLKNMAASETMSKGGYDQSGQAGGFRANIRDATKQREMEESERIVKTDETIDRMVQLAEQEYNARPKDKIVIKRFAERLMERGTPADEQRAIDLLEQAFEDTQEFRFRREAGRIRLRKAERTVRRLREAAEAPGATPETKAAFEAARTEHREAETREFEILVQAYPTDLTLKYELARRLFDQDRFEEAIGLLQACQDDLKNRVNVLNLLGQAFSKIGWYDEAVGTFRSALEAASQTEDGIGLELRYGLLIALQSRAIDLGELDAAEEAYRLASAIAVKQIGYRDIRERRDAIKTLIQQIKQGRGPVSSGSP